MANFWTCLVFFPRTLHTKQLGILRNDCRTWKLDIKCIRYWYNWYLQFAVLTLCYDCKEFVLSLFICQVFLYFILSFANVNRKTNCDPSFEMTFSQHRIWFKNTPNLILNNLGSPWTYFCLLKYNEDFSKLEKPIRHFARM